MESNCVIDGSTERYLARLARESGYFQREFNPKPTREILNEAGIDYISSEDIEMDTGEIATVYKLRLTGDSAGGLEKDLRSRGRTEQAYATDWGVNTAHGYDHLTYYFDTTPTKCDIQKARIINNVKHAIEVGKLQQQFSCRTCGQRYHWTDLTPPTPDCVNAYKQQIIMLRDQQCCCSAGGHGIDHIARPHEVDEYIQARPVDVMTTSQAD